MKLINSTLDERAKRCSKKINEIIGLEIEEYLKSKEYQIVLEAHNYSLNRSDVQRKTNSVASRSNSKIEHPILRKLIKQKEDYLLSKPFTVATDSDAYSKQLNKLFGKKFRKKLKAFGGNMVRHGIAYWVPGINEKNEMFFKKITPLDTVVYWTDSEKDEVDAFLHFYNIDEYTPSGKITVKKAEYWDKNGVRYFSAEDNTKDYKVDTSHGNKKDDYAESHLIINGENYNWEEVPIVWGRYDQGLPLQYFIKELIDDINCQTSVTSDTNRDIAKFIYILKNYGGQDLGEFIKDLRENLAIKVDADGGVDKLQADLNVESVLAFLDKQRKDCFDYGAGVDTKDTDLGNASGRAINFRYADLTSDCEGIAEELNCMFERLKIFIDFYFSINSFGNFEDTEFSIEFNYDMVVNESDIISDIRNSVGIISNKTLLQNHPYVENVEKEEKQIIKEQQEMNDYASLGGEVDEK